MDADRSSPGGRSSSYAWGPVMALGLWASALAAVPPADAPGPLERPDAGPTQVCREMLQAEHDGRIDDLVAHTSAYARERFGFVERVLLRLDKGKLDQLRCGESTIHDSQAEVRMWGPRGAIGVFPFLREVGVWRFDQKRWEDLRRQGLAPSP